MKKVCLVYASDARYGGHVTFTAHLCRALRKAGASVTLYKISNKESNQRREFGYSEYFLNATLIQLCKIISEGVPVLITASNKPLAKEINALIECGARMVVHDPTELSKGYKIENLKKPILIRKTMLKLLPSGVFIPHPYDPLFKECEFDSDWFFHRFKYRKTAISTSRIDFDKNTNLLLDANRLLSKSKKIKIIGFENRIYTRFNLIPKYPEWVQSVAHYPRELRYAVEECSKYKLMIDMSSIKNDGGGTQYTFLEALDAGCILVLNKDWLIKNSVFIDNENCFSASTGKDIANIIKSISDTWYAEEIIQNSRTILVNHEPKKIGNKYIKELQKC